LTNDREPQGGEEQYRRLVELSPDGIFITRDSRIVFVNPAAIRIFGASSPDQVLGRSPYDFSRLVNTHISVTAFRNSGGRAGPVDEERGRTRRGGTVTDVERWPAGC
jgi:PAS domain S-box-containing protein